MLSFEDFVEQSQAQKTVRRLRDLFERVMADEGYDNYILAAFAEGALCTVRWQKFPQGHLETYIAEGQAKIDPVLAYSLRATRPFAWDDVAPHLNLSRQQTAFLERSRRNGVHSVVIVPFPGPGGRREMVGIGKRRDIDSDPARLPVLQAFCAQTWCRYTDLAGGGCASESGEVPVTGRELEILKWVKHGKSNTEISEIMSLSIKTVEYHVGNILRKLGASNRVTAVVIAIRNGMLAL